MFKKFATITLIAILAAFAIPAAAFAGGNDAKLIVVHGINGADLGLPSDLPVDVSVNGQCALPMFKFGDIAGPLTLPEGTYTVAISLADAASPCGGTVVIGPADLMLMGGKAYSVVANLGNMAPLTPQVSVFEEDFSKSAAGKGRVSVHHTANAPAVDIALDRNKKSAMISDFAYGEQVAAEFRAGRYLVSIAPAGTQTIVFGPAPLRLKPFTSTLVYAVGTPGSTFTLLTKEVGLR